MHCLDFTHGRELLGCAELRASEELEELQTHLLMLHWRLTEYSVRPKAMDFVSFSNSCWYGSFDIAGFQIIDNDLGIGGVAINDATDDERATINSLAMERHLAINWLMGDSVIYSETETNT